ncbi:hypothetical protein Tco_0651380, partial [Tanacetum coccineum]
KETDYYLIEDDDEDEENDIEANDSGGDDDISSRRSSFTQSPGSHQWPQSYKLVFLPLYFALLFARILV